VPLGLIEIQSEESTSDGLSSNDLMDGNLADTVTRAADGIKMNGLHMRKAFQAGKQTLCLLSKRKEGC
jgi:hypothetical protein